MAHFLGEKEILNTDLELLEVTEIGNAVESIKRHLKSRRQIDDVDQSLVLYPLLVFHHIEIEAPTQMKVRIHWGDKIIKAGILDISTSEMVKLGQIPN